MQVIFFLILLMLSAFLLFEGNEKKNAYFFLLGSMLLFVTGILLYAIGIDVVSGIDSEGLLLFKSVSGQTDFDALVLSSFFCVFGALNMLQSAFSIRAFKGG